MEGALDKSINVVLRQHFAWYAAYRPVQGLEGGNSKWKNLDIVVIRENTEGRFIRE
jgi:isocitrate dehydrogenase (NAD+)